MKATIVTHVHPDLDALLGTWILIRFGGYDKSEVMFVPVGKRWEESQNAIHVDTGLTQFDHHNRSDRTCAAKLVYDSVFAGRSHPAVEVLVNYALKTDWYLMAEDEHSPFAVNSIIAGLNRLHPDDPRLVAERTFQIFDALCESISQRLAAEREYARGFEFESSFGKAFAIESALGAVREVAYDKGAHVFVFVDPVKGYRGYKARSQEGIDFTDLYLLVKQREPDADWFLHSSRELLLCGSDKAPDRTLSKLSLGELVDFISFKSEKKEIAFETASTPA
jgi:hypothetical protein